MSNNQLKEIATNMLSKNTIKYNIKYKVNSFEPLRGDRSIRDQLYMMIAD